MKLIMFVHDLNQQTELEFFLSLYKFHSFATFDTRKSIQFFLKKLVAYF
ncbi:Uncharacterised protein [Candidatus Ornithobacterium hominis]|nr:Uncharacterised protein [Candidatus Ornithobacterium hominis]